MGESRYLEGLSRPLRGLNPDSARFLSGAQSGLRLRSGGPRRWAKTRSWKSSAGGEEVAEQRAALCFENTPADLDTMVEAGIAYDVPE